LATVCAPSTATAALIFQAAEEGLLGRVGIDARLIDTGALPPDSCRRLHRIDGVSYGERITVRHLLTHTSGLRDAQIDDGETISDGYGSSPAPNSIIGRRAADFRRHIEAVAAGRAPEAGLRTLKHWLPWDRSHPDDADARLVNFYLNNGCADPCNIPRVPAPRRSPDNASGITPPQRHATVERPRQVATVEHGQTSAPAARKPEMPAGAVSERRGGGRNSGAGLGHQDAMRRITTRPAVAIRSTRKSAHTPARNHSAWRVIAPLLPSRIAEARTAASSPSETGSKRAG
jgi:hypothetical protein